MEPVGRGDSVGNIPTRAVAISMVIDGILMVLFFEVASRINYFRGAAGAARLTCCGGGGIPSFRVRRRRRIRQRRRHVPSLFSTVEHNLCKNGCAK